MMMSEIRAIVGLGNPGLDYAKTRHNAGFLALDRLAARRGGHFVRNRFGLVSKWGNIILLKPLTFMNLSGEAVGALAKFYKLPAQSILVISDDLDLPLGKIRVRAHGSSGGHNGLKSITHVLGTDQFPRIKIGISRPPEHVEVIDWVLGRFSREEWKVLDGVLDEVAEACEWAVVKGIADTMNRFNGL
ncbi:peptidyl-tRNA hydrolase, PTH1 family [Sulfobacillus thermosulfidooxidans DSM 9293]|uniref:Peptidyl-tRNA hydrolase n=2 Tax=Sulfobacillus thermosulfidooxidans TaxID=28034 RepID=A0A1W1WA84_SULTA|nr:aminoacyl-tRNA hydrolase [Sulfobacillus thermosulfidooxidans]PSR28807.1 MAG: aminoacyl-tRNA hydrolase [Sulfobacillus thermosulfidooxidans]SMC03211.1 peptidyl-tRNA hydrolase, PTH1 family [Sulfobacillus thermosulfidooxidans DSM 9293]